MQVKAVFEDGSAVQRSFCWDDDGQTALGASGLAGAQRKNQETLMESWVR